MCRLKIKMSFAKNSWLDVLPPKDLKYILHYMCYTGLFGPTGCILRLGRASVVGSSCTLCIVFLGQWRRCTADFWRNLVGRIEVIALVEPFCKAGGSLQAEFS